MSLNPLLARAIARELNPSIIRANPGGSSGPEVIIGTTAVQNQALNTSAPTAFTVPSHTSGDLLVLSFGINKADDGADECLVTTFGWVELAVAAKQVSTGDTYTMRTYTKIGDGIETLVVVGNDTVTAHIVNIGITPISAVDDVYWDVTPAASHVIEELNSANPTAAAITTTEPNTVVHICAHVVDDQTTYKEPAGYTASANNDVSTGSIYICTKTIATPATETPGAWQTTGVGATVDNLLTTLSIMPIREDEFWANVVLLLPFTGANDSTDFVDVSDNAVTMTRSNTPDIDTSVKKFGTGSMKNTSPDIIHAVLDTAALDTLFDLGSGDFTIECHLFADTTTGAERVWAMGPDGSDEHISLLSSNNSLFMEWSVNGSTTIQKDSAHDITDDTWHHVAVVRSGNEMFLYMDGVKGSGVQSMTGITLAALDTDASFFIGGNGGAAGHDGWIDNFRYTKGVARYTEASFTPPARAFPTAPVGGGSGPADVTSGPDLDDLSRTTEDFIGSTSGDPQDVWLDPTGVHLYVMSDTPDQFMQHYTLSTPFALSSRSAVINEFDLVGKRSFGIAGNPSGSKVYIGNFTSGDIEEYDLSPAFDLSTASLSHAYTFDADASTQPMALHFNFDGTELLVGAQTKIVYRVHLAVPYDLSSESYPADSFDASSQVTANTYGVAWDIDGLKMYISDHATLKVYQYTLSVPFDVSTAVYASKLLSTIRGGNTGLHLDTANGVLYVAHSNASVASLSEWRV